MNNYHEIKAKYGNEMNGPIFKLTNDPRIFPFGHFIRKSSIDELPQLLNILCGDMSIVGPRPERECFYIQFERDIPGFKNRMAVIPGLTGHAQVNGGYSLGPREKLVYDLEYIENRSVEMDIKCILKTISVVLMRKDAR